MEVRAPKECVGVARIPVVFLESIACTTATRVGATWVAFFAVIPWLEVGLAPGGFKDGDNGVS